MKCCECNCCQVTAMFGYNLRHGCLIVGLMTIAISLLMFFYGVGVILEDPPQNGYNSDPEIAVQLIFALYAASASLYQILISLLLAWQARLANLIDRESLPRSIRRIVRLIPYQEENIFYCSLWHVSHLSILTLYFILFCAKVAICYDKKDYAVGSIIGIIGIIYISIFIYFAIVVSSFSHSLDQDIFY